jgi:hypothetical protein
MVYRSNLDVSTALPLTDKEREHVLRRARGPAMLDIPILCWRARIPLRVHGGPQARVILWDGPGHGRTVDDAGHTVYAIDRNGLPQRDPERAVRIIEILAYGCFEYAARETICGRGIFVYPLTPDHGRAWLSEIGRRGGRARTLAKGKASRANGKRRTST